MRNVKLWSGQPLTQLWPLLEEESRSGAPGAWVGRRLPSGAAVFLQCGEPPRTLRIARPEKPTTDSGADLFRRECEIFLRHFGLSGWTAVDEPAAPGIAIRFREPEQIPLKI